MSRPIFGPHPHAGVSVMTYMHPDSEGSFRNRDSHGDGSIIEPGGVHVTQAGIGIQHDEVPEHTGTDCHGFQIWINHADQDRLVPPRAFHAKAHEIPEVIKGSVRVRVIQGSYQGHTAPFTLVTPITLLDTTLAPRTSLTLPGEEMTFLYVTSGKGWVAGREINAHDIVLFEKEGDAVEVQATQDNGISFMFASGVPHREPIVYGGPYVMTTARQLEDTQKRFARGEMGTLAPLKAETV
ncbi:pirin family protein [Tunicatimonas pelagia]|uniref:pirin family protein n=1 Tax=Tunicatimonas pelagia TaxID=931531 RepID=UPI002664F0A2|nr:pirin family protein [Tunicatimonas pelagia]WKN46324.1 pirin-like C-terminal cupin domain-containing protein [Tunicatimonas pelagia]